MPFKSLISSHYLPSGLIRLFYIYLFPVQNCSNYFQIHYIGNKPHSRKYLQLLLSAYSLHAPTHKFTSPGSLLNFWSNAAH